MSDRIPTVARVALFAAVFGTGACQDSPEPVDFFAFRQPYHVAFACYDTRNDGSGPRLSEAVQRPLACCGRGRAEDTSDYCGQSPRMHGLVSQNERGEVAAVNLKPDDGESSVVDSDPTVPGYSFTDVGELPAALVVPSVDPIHEECGPRWTYVASAGEREVRAVATCRFRRGVACGPEAALLGLPDVAVTDVTRVALPSEPGDMVLDSAGYLWISLPGADALGRIRLNDGSMLPVDAADGGADGGVDAGDAGSDAGGAADADAGAGAGEAPGFRDEACQIPGADTEDLPDPTPEQSLALQRPFLPGPDGEVLQLFPLNGRLPTVTLPLVDDDGYIAWCGLGSDSSGYPGDRIEQPLASLPGFGTAQDAGAGDAGSDGGAGDAGLDGGATDGGAGLDGGTGDGGLDGGAGGNADVSPNRLRFDPETNLLLASDLERPFLHAWSIDANEEPMPVASLATGAPIWDFALTGPVPERVDLYVDGVRNEDGFPRNEVRYIYAIDNRDKSVLAIRWRPGDGGGGTVELVRPYGPVPNADRVFIEGFLGAPRRLATAIEVIDTRSNDPGQCQPNASGEGNTAREEEPGRLLRGVYVAVATLDGTLQIIDVHEQDLFCEAFGFAGGTGRCNPMDQTQPNPEQRPDGDQSRTTPFLGMAVRRHSLHNEVAQPPDGSGDNGEELGTMDCPEGYLAIDVVNDVGGVLPAGSPAVNSFCVNADPWMQFVERWDVQYEGALPGIGVSRGDGEGYFPAPGGEQGVPDGAARFQISPGVDLCARGVVDAEALGETGPDAYRGDYLVLPRQAPPGAPEDESCDTESGGIQPRFPILEAHDNYLIVGERTAADAADGRMSLEKAQKCFGPNDPKPQSPGVGSGITRFGITVRDRHLVLGQSNAGYLHRVVSDETGRCVLDPEQDPRLRARARVAPPPPEGDDEYVCPDEYVFQNPFVAFCPQREQGGASERSYSLALDVNRAPDRAANALSTGSGRAILPVTVRYLPVTRELFIVDSADEGLLEWGIRKLGLVAPYR